MGQLKTVKRLKHVAISRERPYSKTQRKVDHSRDIDSNLNTFFAGTVSL